MEQELLSSYYVHLICIMQNKYFMKVHYSKCTDKPHISEYTIYISLCLGAIIRNVNAFVYICLPCVI